MPTSVAHYKIAAEIGGDGIGPDVVAEAVRVLDVAAGDGRVPSPLALPTRSSIDYVILRENTEGLFASLGGGSKVGEEVAVDTLVITSPLTAPRPTLRARASPTPWRRFSPRP